MSWWTSLTGALGAKGGVSLAILIGIVITGFFSFIKALFAPQQGIPVWVWFVAGFALFIFLKGQKEQPPIIVR